MRKFRNLPAAVRQAYRNSPRYELDRLLAERARWQRKQTIAGNKLARVQRKLDALLSQYITEKMSHEAK